MPIVIGEVIKMKKPPFKSTLRESGNSCVLTVPRAFVNNELFQLGKEYVVSCEEVDDETPANR
jgi:hypothetical protein